MAPLTSHFRINPKIIIRMMNGDSMRSVNPSLTVIELHIQMGGRFSIFMICLN